MYELLLATNTVGNGSADPFWSSPVGGWIKAILVAVGVLVILGALVKSAKDGLNGKFGNVAKILLGGAVIAAICFRPELLTDLITVMGDVVKKFLVSVKQIGDSA